MITRSQAAVGIAETIKKLIETIEELKKKAKNQEEIAAADRILDLFSGIDQKNLDI